MLGVESILSHRDSSGLSDSARPTSLILIGTSTGGPKALTTVFEQLPVLPGTACCVVQHMPAGFTRNLAKRINQLSSWQCQEAEGEELLQTGGVYIAPGGLQTAIKWTEAGPRFAIAATGPVNGHQPAVDVLFESALSMRSLKLVGVLMTGMGSDGARGLKKIHDAGWPTLAEAEESCVVFGMPRAAIQLEAVDTIVPLQNLAEALVQTWRKTQGLV